MLDLTGKTALVTGGTRGIGKAIAQAMHKQGATVIITGRSEEKAQAVASEIGANAIGMAYEAGNVEKVADFAEAVLTKVEKLDILVNNAGITKDTLMMRMSQDDWQQVIDVNLSSNFALTKAFLPHMMKNRAGRVINMTSIVGVMGNAGQANYAASKAGLIGFSKSMAIEVAPRGITVNCVAPGFIATEMTDAIPEKAREDLLTKIPAKKMGQVEDIANACVYLASDEASYVTGQTLHVNGGMLRV
ncbi:MAG: 3-oxoacyl-[acyl-carrier-protein] reductase [Alphaproteobacteria bacterium]|jgi:3-oxoacyl-[acyl-carrier protein] reductase|nr:3-oxoacyl-[acyl-carrier-protein] reductase [Alphaproteobacteria bacterium]